MQINPLPSAGYVTIPQFENYLINPYGDIISRLNHRPTNTWVHKGNHKLMTGIPVNGRQITVSVVYLLACTFLAVPDELKGQAVRVFHKNRNKADHQLANLEWRSRGYEAQLVFQENVLANKKRFGMPEFGPDNTGYYPNAVKSTLQPGYYYIPGADHPLVVSKQGEVYNLESGMVLQHHPNGQYLILTLRLAGKYQTVYVHRLLAMLFIAIPERHSDKTFDDLEVNHKDGNKINNTLDNLEWVTSKENSAHAIENGLIKYDAVSAKNIQTGEVTRYPSSYAVARDFGLSKVKLLRHLSGKLAGTLTSNWHVFQYEKTPSWPTLEKHHFEQNRWERPKGIWIATSVFGRRRVLANTLDKMSVLLDIPNGKLKTHLAQNDRKKHFEGWYFHYDAEPSQQDIDQLPPRYQPVWLGSKPIMVTDVNTNEVVTYSGMKEASRVLNLVENKIRYAMRTKGGRLASYLFKYV